MPKKGITGLALLSMRFILPAALLVFLFSVLDTKMVFSAMLDADPLLFLAAFAVLCMRNVVGAWRSLLLVRSRNIPLGLGDLSRYYFMGNFLNLFLPEVIGRDLARGYYLYKVNSGSSGGVSSIVAERFAGTAAMMLMSSLSVAALYLFHVRIASEALINTVAIAFGLFSLFTLLLFNSATDCLLVSIASRFSGGIAGKAAHFVMDVVDFYRTPGLVLSTLAISLFFQFIGVVAAFLLAFSLGDTTPFVYFLILLPLIWVIGMLPVSINGLGLREGSFVLLFGAVGMAEETAMAISLLWFAQNIGLGLIGGAFIVTEKRKSAAG